MGKFLPVLLKSPLFAGIGAQDMEAMLDCLGAVERRFSRGEAVLRAGEPARWLGVVLSGRLQVCREDREGRRTVLSSVPPAGIFGEAHACAGTAALPVSVWAVEDSGVLLLDIARVVGTCPSSCTFHSRLVTNLLSVLAGKNILLSAKLEHVSQRTIREKLLSYLNAQAALAGSDSFAIPFDRQALADYLCVDRSALSRELSALRREGILEAEKNRFRLLRGREQKISTGM